MNCFEADRTARIPSWKTNFFEKMVEPDSQNVQCFFNKMRKQLSAALNFRVDVCTGLQTTCGTGTPAGACCFKRDIWSTLLCSKSTGNPLQPPVCLPFCRLFLVFCRVSTTEV